jgi:multiple sugar transport system substrate-binding protein
MFEMEQALGNEINRAITGQITGKEALENGQKAWIAILAKNGFGTDKAPVQYADVKAGTYVGAGKPLPF